jgi:hypothetical protein
MKGLKGEKKTGAKACLFFLFPGQLSGGASTVIVGLRLSLSAFEGNARFFE